MNAPTRSRTPAFWTTAGRWLRLDSWDPGLLAVALLLLIVASPLFQRGLPNVADAPIHLFRTAEWVRSWQAGILLPRWSPTLAYGYGHPLFVFAPPLPYALAGALHLAGLSLETAIKLLCMGSLAVAGFLAPFIAAGITGVLILGLGEDVTSSWISILYLTVVPLALLTGLVCSLKSIPLIDTLGDKDYAYSGLTLNILFLIVYITSLIYFLSSPGEIVGHMR